jgi:hypothetical protein
MQGLGSAIEKVTKAVGIRTCAGCKKRKEWIDRKVPFPIKKVSKHA